MDLHFVFAILAIMCFLLSALDVDQGKGIPVGLIFLVCLVAF